MERLPALFVGHGSPMNMMIDNEVARNFRALGRSLPRPEAVCVISAHWLGRKTFVSCQERPEQIYDFYGFPRELYTIRYEPRGHPSLALRAVKKMGTPAACNEGWGHDHAGWSVLRHLFPSADVPVFLVGIDMTAPPAAHLALGRKLGELREEGVLLMGSGNIVHNLYEASFDEMDAPPDPLGVAFDRAIARAIEEDDFATLTDYRSLGDAAAFSVPTADHYLPMLYTVGARRGGESLRFFNAIFQNRTVSMRSFIIG